MNPFTFEGDWSFSEKMMVYRAIITVGKHFSKLIGGTTRNAYMLVYEGLTFSFNPNSYYNAVASRDEITFKHDRMSVFLVVHELMHVLARRLYPNGPMDVLMKEGIYTKSGKFLTGTTIYRYYYRNNGIPYPKWYEKDAQFHPLYMPDSNTPAEDWAEMAGSVISGKIKDNEEGRTIREWVQSHLKVWLEEYKKGKENGHAY